MSLGWRVCSRSPGLFSGINTSDSLVVLLKVFSFCNSSRSSARSSVSSSARSFLRFKSSPRKSSRNSSKYTLWRSFRDSLRFLKGRKNSYFCVRDSMPGLGVITSGPGGFLSSRVSFRKISWELQRRFIAFQRFSVFLCISVHLTAFRCFSKEFQGFQRV